MFGGKTTHTGNDMEIFIIDSCCEFYSLLLAAGDTTYNSLSPEYLNRVVYTVKIYIHSYPPASIFNKNINNNNTITIISPSSSFC